MDFRVAMFCLLALAPDFVSASNYVLVKLPRGVELQLPKNWRALTAQEHQLIDLAAEASVDLSGIEPSGQSANLIAASSVPAATRRVSR